MFPSIQLSGPYLHGAVMMLSLTVAIGAQNTLVLRQGLARLHVVPVIAVCVIADVILTSAGVLGLSRSLSKSPGAVSALTWVGIAFLGWFAVQAFSRALTGKKSLVGDGSAPPASRRATIGSTLAVTILNPHVYLDTLVLIGAVGASYARAERPLFVAGAGSASLLWFSMLGLGSGLAARWLDRPLTWRLLDAVIGVVMVSTAWSLVP